MSKLLITTSFCLLLSGCATLVHGPTQIVPVTTKPPGATILVDGKDSQYVSPCDLILERKTGHILKISKEGYQDAIVDIEAVISKIALGNVIVGGIPGLAVDAATGAINHLFPEKVDVTLSPR